ncbi:triose-phosphate isomerase [Sulfurovum sp. bin170]|uniref:triose-phosphate isomerase n=1 Tax=Sulfurovum sp. bin170 TaxID=2695268 RepID=UPI0013DF6517|nr:triose-phosphate isomerase [Sulfurovum sp. bin170]NEW59962.1 triose-phosphate isomerase [Sulfurovum sp. bin170]
MIYAANFKTNHTRESTKEYITDLQSKLGDKKPEDRVFVFPPLTALDSFEGDFTIGAQNAYPVENGAYTGEVGVEQLSEFNINTILIGHSERRDTIGESQEQVAKKFAFFKEQGFEIIYCIGESLEVREQGIEAVMEHLVSQFEGIDTTYDNFVVAYEPIWAIGTGRSATVAEIVETHNALKQIVDKPLLYGGSVKGANIAEISAISNVDGVLVGGASLKTETFLELVFH